MDPTLNYAPPESRQRSIIAAASVTLPLSVGVIAYALLCIPAATQRGYPPIDHVWKAVTYLWVIPIPLFVLCSSAGRVSKSALLIYAIASGYIDACTVVTMVPHRLSFIGALFNSILLVPMHLVGAGIISWACRSILSRLDRPQATRTERRIRSVRISAFVAIVLLAVLFPFVYRNAALRRQEIDGRNLADADWAAHTAVIRSSEGRESEHPFGDATITSRFDMDSGLPLQSEMQHGFEQSYEARIKELLRLQGVPPWSQKGRFVTDGDLVSMLTATDMMAITAFPYDAAPGIVLLRNCSATRWGVTMGSSSNDLSVGAQFSGMNGFGSATNPVSVGRLKKYPHLVFVRSGQKWVAACTDDGWILGYATRESP